MVTGIFHPRFYEWSWIKHKNPSLVISFSKHPSTGQYEDSIVMFVIFWAIHYSSANSRADLASTELVANSIHSFLLPIHSLTPSYGSFHDLNKITDPNRMGVDSIPKQDGNSDEVLKLTRLYCEKVIKVTWLRDAMKRCRRNLFSPK